MTRVVHLSGPACAAEHRPRAQMMAATATHATAATATHATAAKSPPISRVGTRRHELDWLRSLIVLGLIPIHTATLFSLSTYFLLQAGQTSVLLTMLIGLMAAWAMPLLFLVAGGASWFALGSRSPRQYLQERMTRLLLPFIFATLALIPLQLYTVLSAQPQLLAGATIPVPGTQILHSYGQFYLAYLAAYGYFMTHFSMSLVPIFWAHLWFLPRLFVVGVLLLPVMRWLRGPRGCAVRAHLLRLCARPGGILLLGLPLVLTNLAFASGWLNTLTAHWPIYDDWDQFLLYLLFFLLGYVLYSDARFGPYIERDGLAALAGGAVLWGIAQLIPPPSFTPPLQLTSAPMLFFPFRSMIAWLLGLGVLSLAMRYFRFTSRAGRYINDAAFPIYVLHLPVLVLIGVSVAAWPISLYAKFAVITVATALALILLYDVLIKRSNVLRVLFGLKPRASDHPATRKISIVSSPSDVA